MKLKYIVFIIVFVSLISSVSYCSTGFSTKVLNIQSVNFPNISTLLKVYTKTPTTLLKDNFELLEDDKKISSFSVKIAKPTHYIVLALDRSSSIKPSMNDVKNAACVFIKNMPENFKIAIVSFGSDVDIEQDFTANKNLLQKRVWKIRPYGGTSLYDALYLASELLLQSGKQIDIKTIICLTDGRDCNPAGTKPMSIRTSEKAIFKATQAQARIISLGLGKDIDSAILTKMSKATNGAYLPVLTTEKLSLIYQKLGQRLKLESYLTINYTTPDTKLNGTIRNVTIKSNWQNYNNQGSGTYRAPLPVVSEQPIKKLPNKTTKFKHQTLEAQYVEFHYIPMVKEKYKIRDKDSFIRKFEYTNNRFADETSIIDKEPGKWELISSEQHLERRTIEPGKSVFSDKELARGARVESMEKFYIHGKAKILTGVEYEEE